MDVAVGGQAPAHVEIRRHDARGRGARDVDDLVAVEGGERARFVQRLAEAIEDRLRQDRERRRGQVAMGERQHARAQVEPAGLVHGDEAQRGQRVQAAPRRGAGDAGAVAHLRDRHAPLLVGQREQHREPAGQRGDEVGIVAVTGDGVGHQRVRVGERRRRGGRDVPAWRLRGLVGDRMAWHVGAAPKTGRNDLIVTKCDHSGRSSPIQYINRP